jgi:hypothetical protein
MTRLSIAGALAVATLSTALGCQDVRDSSVELTSSALAGTTGAGGGISCTGFAGAVGTGGTTGTDTTPVRGFIRSNGTHAAVYRNGNATISQLTGTPLANPVNLGGVARSNSAPWGYRRHDGANAVVYIDPNSHLHEIILSGAHVSDTDFSNTFNVPPAATGDPVPDVIGYVRSDNRSALVYRNNANHVIEVLSNFGNDPAAWVWTDLTIAASAPVTITAGSAFPWVRSDGLHSIVYIANDNHIHDLFTDLSPNWFDGDLSAASGETIAPSSDPWGYRRADGFNAVVFVGTDNKLHELGYFPGGGWGTAILPAVNPSGGLYRRPSGYVRADGLNAVVYVSGSTSLHEVELREGSWVDATLAFNCQSPISQPFGGLAAANRSSVLFRAGPTSTNRYELSSFSLGPWSLQRF